ncbi:hypothetical protein A4X09_0g5188 [Tilletia walkeri]|uniref:FAD-binding FR-type domain-containing protein n=1 Tax=Tilletia walkeri TaxID=117179 RepID=A0A8X7N695_9BASI|nr:hypothetical protein A4X09_0g5188 [Tilletia walkeri]
MTASSRLPKPHPLTDEEILSFFHDISGSKTASHITFAQLEAKLHQVHEVLAPNPKKHHLHHPSRAELEGGNGLHSFLVSLLPDVDDGEKQSGEAEQSQRDINANFQISKDDFLKEVQGWNVPSPDQSRSDAQAEEADAVEYEKKLPFRRKLAAHWSVEGPTYLFMTFVIALQLAFGLWQGFIYVKNQPIRQALGWGVIVAKFSAGALYPTLFFMLISMSRWIATLLRRSYLISRFINADFHQSFHVRLSIVGLLLATLHAIGHLTGTFLYSSRPGQAQDVIAAGKPVRSYREYVSTLPGWSGLVSLGLFWTIALLSSPKIRKWNYEVFQIGHLLMFPMVGFLAAHGTAKLLQGPMLGYWLVFPTIAILLERLHRIYRSLRPIQARLEVLDDDTVCLTARHPRNKDWRYSAGQYILLQIPRLSKFQFHPFTISACVDDCLQVHIKTSEGDWTSALRELALEVGPDADVRIGIDGPFGAPAQRFYDYQKSIIVGSGIGITPFVAALTDLEQKAIQGDISPWRKRRLPSMQRALSRTTSFPAQVVTRMRSRSSSTSDVNGNRTSGLVSSAALREALSNGKRQSDDEATIIAAEGETAVAPSPQKEAEKDSTAVPSSKQRRVDFIWLVRDKSHLLWFSDLLNRVADYASSHRKQQQEGTDATTRASGSTDVEPVDLRINTFITAKRKNISTHVFRILLDRYRSDASPVSALTGLRTESSFGRPDLEAIMTKFYEDVVLTEGFRGNIGVFFCGTPIIGRVLADQCAQLTARARADKADVRFHFLMEVFG